VTVTALCPGPTATGFQKRAGMEGTRLFGGGGMDSAAVARQGYEGMMRGARIVIPGLRNRLAAQALRFAPRRVVTQIARSLQERRTG
jgi:short-subunit dehydrogenase